MKKGKLVENGAELKSHERKTVIFLLECGYDIELIPKSNVQGKRSPDIRMLGLFWEMKAPKGEGKSLMKNTLQKAARQAENVIVDLRRTKRYQTKCLVELEKEFKISARIRWLKIITKSGEMLDLAK